jgi:4-amino-4-deoxy-L-arabinose transferase-like glycosyltransferase
MIPITKRRTKNSFLLFVPLVCLFVFLRLWHLTTYGLNRDEIFSLQAAHLGWTESINYAIADIVHPPLFYLLLKLWLNIGGESFLWLKLFPVLISIGTLVPFWLLCRELKLTGAETATALFLISVNAFLIHYSQELRMYSLLVFLALWSCWLFVRLVNDKGSRKWILVGVFAANLLLIYTHYFGWLLIGAEGLYLLIRKRRHLLPFSLSVAALAVCFAPWAYQVFRAAQAIGGLKRNLDWIDRPRLSHLVWYFAALHGLFHLHHISILGVILFGFPLVGWMWQLLKGERESEINTFWLLVSFSLPPVIFVFLANYFLTQPVWSERFLIIHAIPYLILIAVAANRLHPAWISTLILLLITVWAGLSGFHILRLDNTNFNWFSVAEHMTRTEGSGSGRVPVYAIEDVVAIPLESSLKFVGKERFEVIQITDLPALDGRHFWVVFRQATWEQGRLPQALLRDRGCHVGQEFSVSPPPGGLLTEEAVTAFPVSCGP